MAQPRYSIGIDLGTTNSALAFAALDGDAAPKVLAVPQWEALGRLVEGPTLPSFLYLPDAATAAQLQGRAEDGGAWVVGRLARAKAADSPGRVVHSAKSWLGHHAADRTAPFLPWGSSELGREEKISPVRASALILNALRAAWDAQFEASGCAFDDQLVTVTVPASFDAAAQLLTLTAAKEAGFPAGVRLLEEPQAAFTCWLAGQDAASGLAAALADRPAGPRHVLVVDIGGGTSDFSLFELRGAGAGLPEIRRVAVSEHILLGGDNIDLALAHLVEARLGGGQHGHLSGAQWEHLVAACRDLKETALSAPGTAEESFAVALPGRGASLFASAQTATLTRAEIEAVLLDGFFPDCPADATPYQPRAALRELGLPYAADSAVTRHLAQFLREQPRVDAVLFNGGSVTPARLRSRLCAQIAAWQGGTAPLVLENAEPDLAVALGAARFGALPHRQSRQIAAGAAQATFLQVQGGAGEKSLVCVLPQGAPPEQDFHVAPPGLAVRTGQAVRFQAFSSTRHAGRSTGEVVAWREGRFHELPALETRIDAAGADTGTLAVALRARMNALGLLQVACVSADAQRPGEWMLEFNLRLHERGAGVVQDASAIAPNATAEAVAAACSLLAASFAVAKSAKLAAPALFKSLERILGAPRAAWNAPLLRALWPALEARIEGRRVSVEHEETWLTLAGFLLRPGFGVAGDAARMDRLWGALEAGPCFPGKRIKVHEYLLWRRVAGGLSRERQNRLLAGEMERLRGGKAPDELVRLAGSLEFLAPETKATLVAAFIDTALTLARGKGHCAAYLASLGHLLNRAPLLAGPEDVLPPARVEAAYAAFRGFDWADADLMELQTLFLRAARVVGDRSLDLPHGVREQIAGKLEKAGVAPLRTARVRDFQPVGRADRAGLLDESLPPGLVFGEG